MVRVPQFVGLARLLHRRDRRDEPRRRSTSPRPTPSSSPATTPSTRGMRWGLFQMAEYINMIVLSALAVTLFFGGWDGPSATARRRSGSCSSSFILVCRLHLAARDAAAPALRPADALRLEGAAAGRDDQRGRHRPRVVVSLLMRRSRIDTPQGLRRDVQAALQEADHAAVPGVQAAGLPALPRPPPALHRTRTGSRSASAARSAPPPARPTASASSPARTRRTTASRRASATRASTRST